MSNYNCLKLQKRTKIYRFEIDGLSVMLYLLSYGVSYFKNVFAEAEGFEPPEPLRALRFSRLFFNPDYLLTMFKKNLGWWYIVCTHLRIIIFDLARDYYNLYGLYLPRISHLLLFKFL